MEMSTPNRQGPALERGRVGTNVRHLLGMHGLHQVQLAEYLDLSTQGLWNILHGRSEPRSRTAWNLAAAFGITVEDLFSDTGSCVRAGAQTFERAPVRTAYLEDLTSAAQ
jgi:transcriptional regulator with XRE-family HTH domain